MKSTQLLQISNAKLNVGHLIKLMFYWFEKHANKSVILIQIWVLDSILWNLFFCCLLIRKSLFEIRDL